DLENTVENGRLSEAALTGMFVPPPNNSGAPSDPAPAWPSSPGGGDSYDSTTRLTLESYQRPEFGAWGESMRFLNKTVQAKTMIAWYHPVDPDEPWDPDTNPMNPIADVWVGAHWGGQTDGTGIHGHWS